MPLPGGVDRTGMHACTGAGVDETAGGSAVVAELRRAMREGMLRALPDDEVSVTLTEKGRAVLLDQQRQDRGQTRLLRDIRAMGRLQGDCNE